MGGSSAEEPRSLRVWLQHQRPVSSPIFPPGVAWPATHGDGREGVRFRQAGRRASGAAAGHRIRKPVGRPAPSRCIPLIYIANSAPPFSMQPPCYLDCYRMSLTRRRPCLSGGGPTGGARRTRRQNLKAPACGPGTYSADIPMKYRVDVFFAVTLSVTASRHVTNRHRCDGPFDCHHLSRHVTPPLKGVTDVTV
jgi:hypothetical protein